MSDDDWTDGYSSGDECPDCDGLIEIRGTLKPGREVEYAQCGNCSWNTLRDHED